MGTATATDRRGRLSRLSAASACAAIALAVLASCAEPASHGNAADDASGFDFVSFFKGRSFSKGTVTTALISTEAFNAVFSGAGNGSRLRLDERFSFADGSPLQRWDITRTGPGRYEGTVSTQLGSGTMAPKVAVEGIATPGGAVLLYDGYAPGGSGILLGFRHEMTLNRDGTVANHVVISKFGLPLATSDVTFAKNEKALQPQ